MNNKWIEVFKAGKYPQGNVTNADLQELVTNYDPKYFESPITIDHIDTGPSYGWVEKVKLDGDKLYALFHDVEESFQEDVKKGRYKNRSIEYYPNLDGKGKYLRAVSFLGAHPPAVKGMAPITFSEAKKITFPNGDYLAFDEYRMPAVGRVLQNIREWILEKFGSDEANKVINQFDIDALKEPLPSDNQAFSDNNQQKFNLKELTVNPEEIEKLKADNTRLLKFQEDSLKEKAAFIAFKENIRKENYNKWLEEKTGKGQLLPKYKEEILTFMMALKEDEVIKFSEDKKENPVTIFKSFVDSIPANTFADLTGVKKYTGNNASKKKESVYTEDDRELLHERILKYRDEHPDVSYEDALYIMGGK